MIESMWNHLVNIAMSIKNLKLIDPVLISINNDDLIIPILRSWHHQLLTLQFPRNHVLNDLRSLRQQIKFASAWNPSRIGLVQGQYFSPVSHSDSLFLGPLMRMVDFMP